MVLLFCIFHDQVATAAGLNITTEYCHIVWLSYNCYRCHFPEGRNFLRFFAKSPHPTDPLHWPEDAFRGKLFPYRGGRDWLLKRVK